MKIYIAARFHRQAEARALGEYMTRHFGHEITSGWLNEVGDDPITAANRDLADIDRAEALLLLTTECETRKGMWVELGYALAKGKHIYVLGPMFEAEKCVFIHLSRVQHVRTVGDIPTSVPESTKDEQLRILVKDFHEAVRNLGGISRVRVSGVRHVSDTTGVI